MPRLATFLLLAVAASAAAQTAPAPAKDPHAPENAGRTALIESLDQLAARQTAARRAEIAKISTRAEAEARQAKVRATMLRLIGPLPTRTPLNAQVTGENKAPGITIQKVLFDSQPAFHVTALLYLPDPLPPAKLPAIVMAPGHSPAGKAGDFAFAAAFARAGFAVLSYDPLGQGERLQYPDGATPPKTLAKGPTGEHGEASLQPILLGESLAKYMLWDGMRAVDYLETRAEVDPKRIGAFGCSGGGAMTALLGALDPRIAATGTACYITSFDTLLPSVGPQDGEQSTPGWIAAGLDFPDWVELAAPKPYAIIATTGDMFPYSGALSTEAEARRFYRLFRGERMAFASPEKDTQEFVYSSDSPLHFITGQGGHGNLRPLLGQIIDFFLAALPRWEENVVFRPRQVSRLYEAAARETPPAGALQVTPTGQVSTSYPNSATIFSLNLAHAAMLPERKRLSVAELQRVVRSVTAISSEPVTPEQQAINVQPPKRTPAECQCGPIGYAPYASSANRAPTGQRAGTYGNSTRYTVEIPMRDGTTLPAILAVQNSTPQHRVTLLLTDALPLTKLEPSPRFTTLSVQREQTEVRFAELAGQGTVLAISLPPSPPGSEELKAQTLGPYYLLDLRAELTGSSLLGVRLDDLIQIDDYLAGLFMHPAPNEIAAEASGHQALVLLHAAVLDPRLKHITLHAMPPTYAQLLATPLPVDAPQDLLPGVLLHYDIPDLIRALGPRVTVLP